jgi:hypothetical protein
MSTPSRAHRLMVPRDWLTILSVDSRAAKAPGLDFFTIEIVLDGSADKPLLLTSLGV